MATSGDLARKTSEMRKGHSARRTDKTSFRNAAPTWKRCDCVKADGGVLGGLVTWREVSKITMHFLYSSPAPRLESLCVSDP